MGGVKLFVLKSNVSVSWAKDVTVIAMAKQRMIAWARWL
jgi:hypothetical protein